MTKTAHQKTERPPVVCIMGHIDHGKSTLLDYIRKTNIVDTEAGGITQKVSAYEVIHKHNGTDKKITFLDTPGHESFGAIRSRGVEVADIAILVVSAEDGVKKQTIEALQIIVKSEIPYIVAINKIDKPGADIEKTKMNLSENGIYLEGYGGNISYTAISAKTGQGVDELLDLLLLTAEFEELTGETEAPAEGAVIEAYLDSKKGVSATLIIKNGSIGGGSYVVCGDSFAPTRMMENFLGKKITEATFSSPVKVIGFNKLPSVGFPFVAVETKKEAEQLSADFKEINNTPKNQTNVADVENTVYIPIIIKTENVGSLEGIQHEIAKIKNEFVKIKIVDSGIGDITEGDVKNATSGKDKAYIVGFNTKVDTQAKILAERDGIEIKVFDIIYKIAEWLGEMASSRTPKFQVEETTARAKVLKYFSSIKDKHVFGGRVEMGTIESGDEVKILRAGIEVGKGKIRELQQQKEKTREVREGVEFGCMLQGPVAVAPGDKIEIYKIVEK